MTDTYTGLILAALAFTGGHFLLSSPWLRPRLLGRLGTRVFLGGYSLVMMLALIWLVLAYAGAPFTPLWQVSGLGWLPLILMLPAAILFAGSLSRGNPTAVAGHPERLPQGPQGMLAITRHPMMWAFVLWSGSHLIANGDLASTVFFGAFLVLALFGTRTIDAKLQRNNPEGWQRLRAISSNLPLAALLTGRARLEPQRLAVPVTAGVVLYVLLLGLHPWLFGASPLP